MNQLSQNYHPRKYQVGVSVAPSHPGRGIGSRLFDLLLSEAQARDALLLGARAFGDRPRASDSSRAEGSWSRADSAARASI